MVFAGLLLIAYLALDTAAVRDRVAAGIETLTGRTVGFAGELELAWSWQPTLAINGVTFANAAWGSQSEMLDIGRLEAQIALRPLLVGDIRIRRVALFDASLLLETGPQGRGNWVLATGPAVQGHSDPQVPAGMPVIDRVGIHGLTLVWHDGASGERTDVHLDRLTLTGIGTGQGIRVQAGSDDAVPSTRLAWSLDLRLATTATGYRVDDLAVSAGDSDLGGELALALGAGSQRLTGQLASSRLRPQDFLDALGIADTASAPADRDGRLFPATPLRLSVPGSLEIELNLAVRRLGGPGPALEELSARIQADQGVLLIDRLEAQLADGRLVAELELDTRPQPPRLRLQLTGKKIQFGRLLAAAGNERWLDAAGDLDIRVQGSGRSIAEIMAGLSGETRLLIGEGRADLKDVDTLVGGLSTALGTLVDKGAEQARLNCIAGSFEIDDGIAASRLLLADTEHSTVIGEGRIDLGAERLDLLLKPQPKTPSLNIAVPVQVGGTLTAPSFTPDKLATARKGVGLLAAVGLISFPPAILLGLGELGSGGDNPCLKLAATAEPPTARQGRSAVGRAADDVKSAIDDIGGAIKGLFE